MNNLWVGKLVSVKVVDIATYGLLVEYGSQQGIIKIPELSWDIYGLQNRIPSTYEVGHIIQVKILSQDDNVFYASLREVNFELDPWHEHKKVFTGQTLQGEVVLVTEYGYLIKLPNFAIGVLLNENSYEKLEKGEKINVKVISVDVAKQNIFLKTSADL